MKLKFPFQPFSLCLSALFFVFQISWAQGPQSTEAAGFEPVDATDMVSLTTGNLSYVLPLLDVEGFPVTLSYHAGMTMDMNASWVGLGWYLNPGAINRTITNTPDDWKGGVGINFNSFEKEENYYGVSISVGLEGGASVGVGLNWGGGQGLSGSVSVNIGLSKAMESTGIKAGVSASADTRGNASIGANVGIKIGSFNAGASVSYSLNNQWDLSGGISKSLKDGKSSIGSSISSNGFSIGGSKANSKGARSGGGVGMSSDSFSMGDASIDTQTSGFAVPLGAVTIGFSKTKVKINIKKGYLNKEWGAIYSSDPSITWGSPRIKAVSGYYEFYNDYLVRTQSMDTYSTRLPQSEEQFIGDYSKAIENVNFTHMGYDDYSVAAPGIMGSMTPHIFKNASIYGKGQITKNAAEEPIHAFWHYGTSTSRVDKSFGRNTAPNPGNYGRNDLYFYFNGQFTSVEKNDAHGLLPSKLNSVRYFDQLVNNGTHNGTSMNNAYHGRAKSPNYIEVFTNNQIAKGHAAARGLISPATISNADRNNRAKFAPDGIGAYKITAPDGKTYHFALPVYHFEQVQRGQIDVQENYKFDIANVSEKRQYTRYATHWLLTAITGPDYIDRPDPAANNRMKTFNKEDYGYWVELEYGHWSDGFVWRSPYYNRVYNYNTNIKGDIEEKDKGNYSFGRKQLYYLDKINTKNRTALFVKELRADNYGKDLEFRYTNQGNKTLGHSGNGKYKNSLNYTNPGLDVQETGVHYKREYSLKLSKIVLVDSDHGKKLSKSTRATVQSNMASPYGRFGGTYNPNDTCRPNWNSVDFNREYVSGYSYGIHNEYKVLDVRDVSTNFIENHALKVVEFKHSYDLAKNSPSSSEIHIHQNPKKGKLTLDAVHFKGKGNAEYMPPTAFNYYMETMPNVSIPKVAGGTTPNKHQIKTYVEQRKKLVDPWGFLQGTYQGQNKAMAWSLKDIALPTGAKIEIEYEEDDYWIEAFARRYWEDELQIGVFDDPNPAYKQVHIKTQNGIFSKVNFQDYFNVNERVFIDLCIHRYRRWRTTWLAQRESTGYIRLTANDNVIVKSVSENLLVLKFSNNNNQYRVWGNDYSASLNNFFDKNGQGSHIFDGLPNCQRPNTPIGGINNAADHLNMKYKLLANKVPEDETGGGLRVKELRTIEGGNTYKAQYDYTHPTENRSSGITSFAPVDGLKFVPYQSELPPPGVMYEYVTMKETSNSGDYYSKTRYRHHVLKPVFDIFNPDIEMEALDADAPGEDRIFWAKVSDNYGGMNGSNSKKIKAKKIDINVNTALIGQVKSVENINSKGHVVMRTENEYINGTHLNGNGAGNEPNLGYTKETFNSMKSIFRTSDDGKTVHDVKRLLSISSRTDYNNMLKKTRIYAGGQKSLIEYSDVDPWLGSFRKSVSTLADGRKQTTVRVPAYEKYSAMRSKVLNHNNKNMLTQEAMSITTLDNGKTLNASLTSWSNRWTYRNHLGQDQSVNDVWRKYKTFVWKDQVNSDGTYQTTITPTQNYFNWGVGTPTTNKWQNVSQITRYSHWSDPLEIRDINNNFSSTKMADNFSKVVATGNARYTEMYYSGAEYVAYGNTFEGEVSGAQLKTNEYYHTGKQSIKLTSASQKGFRIQGSVGAHAQDLSKTFRPGVYRVSVWSYCHASYKNVQLIVNGKIIEPSESEKTRGWNLYNYDITLHPNTNVEVYFKNPHQNPIYLDDFRLHPVYAKMNTYVYDQATDELIYILNSNNLGTLYCYDDAGRLCATYTERGGSPVQRFKVVQKNRYKYKGASENSSCQCQFGKTLLNNQTP